MASTNILHVGSKQCRALARISELGVQKWGELGVQFLFIPLHYTQKNTDIRVSKGHPDTPLEKGLLTMFDKRNKNPC